MDNTFEFVPDQLQLPAVIGPQAVIPFPYVVTDDSMQDPPGVDPDGADWHGARTVNWLEDPARIRVHAQGVKAWKTGNRAIWVVCACAARIVGNYARGATQAFATDISRSVDTVENMAHAAELYVRLQRDFFRFRDATETPIYWPLIPRLRAIRAKLYYTHFSEMWTLWRKDPSLTALAIFADLETAAANGISSRQLKDQGAGSDGSGSSSQPVILQVHGLRADYIQSMIAEAAEYPADTYVVILQGREWVGVDQVKVRPA